MTEVEVISESRESVEPSFDDPPGYKDEVVIEELVGDVLVQKPSVDEYEECCLLLIGLPVVNETKLPKLKTVLAKVLDTISKEHNEHFPCDETGTSRGCVFVEWTDKETALHAKSVLDKYALDKHHVFTAILFAEMKKVEKPDEHWKPPEPAPYVDVGNLWSWTQNLRCNDQFAMLYSKNGAPTVGVFWNVKGHEPQLVSGAERSHWTETVFNWSPWGSYIATVHHLGVAIWGGDKLERVGRFAHERVRCFDFSPKETYLVTFAFPEQKWADDSDGLRIWDVRTGELKKSFSLYGLTNRNELPGWPFFQWSHDEKFFACLKRPEKDKLEKEKRISGITVFSSTTMAPVDRKGIFLDGIEQFKWSPTGDFIAYHSQSTAEDLPSELGVISYPLHPTRNRAARIYNVCGASLYWQKSGAHLAIHTLRYHKRVVKEHNDVKFQGEKSFVEIFDVSSKEISLQTLELADPFLDFGWEPTGQNGDRFCVLVGSNSKATPLVFVHGEPGRWSLEVYRLDPSKHAPQLLSQLDAGVQLNTVLWAPAGGWLAVLAARSTGGNIAFFDTNGQLVKRTNMVEHPGFNKGWWDPTGRFFVSCSTAGGRLGADLGYRIYTFQGRELVRKNMERLVQFKWRPRPPVKLSDEKLKEIRKNLKTTAIRFEKEDNEEKERASQEVVDKRRKVMGAFEKIRKRCLDIWKRLHDERVKLRGVDTEKEPSSEDLVDEHILVPLRTIKELVGDVPKSPKIAEHLPSC